MHGTMNIKYTSCCQVLIQVFSLKFLLLLKIWGDWKPNPSVGLFTFHLSRNFIAILIPVHKLLYSCCRNYCLNLTWIYNVYFSITIRKRKGTLCIAPCFLKIRTTYMCVGGHAMAQLDRALRYKPEGRGFIRIFLWHNPCGRTRAPRSTQPLTEMFTRNISRKVMKAGAWGWLTAFMCWLFWNLGASASWNPEGLSRSVLGTLNILHVGVWIPQTPDILPRERIPGTSK